MKKDPRRGLEGWWPVASPSRTSRRTTECRSTPHFAGGFFGDFGGDSARGRRRGADGGPSALALTVDQLETRLRERAIDVGAAVDARTGAGRLYLGVPLATAAVSAGPLYGSVDGVYSFTGAIGPNDARPNFLYSLDGHRAAGAQRDGGAAHQRPVLHGCGGHEDAHALGGEPGTGAARRVAQHPDRSRCR